MSRREAAPPLPALLASECAACVSLQSMKVCGDLLFSQGLGSGGGEEGQDGEDLLLQQLGLA